MHPSIRLHLRARALLALLLTLALLGLLVPAPARAAGFTVTTLDDSGPGSLREAIGQANDQTGADTISHLDGSSTRWSGAPHSLSRGGSLSTRASLHRKSRAAAVVNATSTSAASTCPCTSTDDSNRPWVR